MTKSTNPSRRAVIAGIGAGGALLGAGPALAQTATLPPLTVWGKLPAVEAVALSPGGTRVAMIMDKGGERAIVDYELATGSAAAGIIDGDKLRDLMWIDNDFLTVVSSKTMKDVGTQWEQWFGLMMNLRTGKRRIMFDGIAGVNTTVISGNINRIKTNDGYRVTASGWKVPDGVNASSEGNKYSQDYNECLFYFNPATGRGFALDEDARDIDNWVVKPDGRLAARSEYNDDQGRIFTIRMKTEKGWNQVYSVKADLDRPSLLGLGRDGESVLVGLSAGDKADTYFELDATGKITTLEAAGSGHYPIFHPQTKALAGFGNSGPIDTYTFFDPIMQRLPKLINGALPESINDLVSIAENPRQVVVRSENAEDAGTYFFFDFTTGAFKEIGSSYPALPVEWIAPKSHITYKAADGLEIGAWLTLPPGGKTAKNLALVVLPHGGPEALDDVRFDWMSQAIASRGYAVLQPNFRGSAGLGKAFTEAGYGEFGRKMQTDLSDGVAHLVRQGTVDAKKVAIAGASYGGYAALAGVSLQAGIYNCAVSIAGLSDLNSFNAFISEWSNFDSNSYSMRYWKRFTGPEGGLDAISPVRHSGDVSVPVMLIHGKDDIVVPYKQTELMYDALKKAGKPVELVVLNGEDHWLSRETSRVQTLESMVGFLLKHNPPT